jgi:hypothetical protein
MGAGRNLLNRTKMLATIVLIPIGQTSAMVSPTSPHQWGWQEFRKARVLLRLRAVGLLTLIGMNAAGRWDKTGRRWETVEVNL